jgi:hypothetical protein
MSTQHDPAPAEYKSCWNPRTRQYDVPPQLAVPDRARAALNSIAWALADVAKSGNIAVRLDGRRHLLEAVHTIIAHGTDGDDARGVRFAHTLTTRLDAGDYPGDAIVHALRAAAPREVKETTPDA